jgi:hypothetical protein
LSTGGLSATGRSRLGNSARGPRLLPTRALLGSDPGLGAHPAGRARLASLSARAGGATCSHCAGDGIGNSVPHPAAADTRLGRARLTATGRTGLTGRRLLASRLASCLTTLLTTLLTALLAGRLLTALLTLGAALALLAAVLSLGAACLSLGPGRSLLAALALRAGGRLLAALLPLGSGLALLTGLTPLGRGGLLLAGLGL